MTTREYFILSFHVIKGQMEKQGVFEEAACMVVVNSETKGNTATVNVRNNKTGRAATAKVVKEGGSWKVDWLR